MIIGNREPQNIFEYNILLSTDIFLEYKKFLIQKMSWSKNVGPSIFLGHGHKGGIYLEADYGILAPIVRVFSKWPEKFGLDASLGCQSFKT